MPTVGKAIVCIAAVSMLCHRRLRLPAPPRLATRLAIRVVCIAVVSMLCHRHLRLPAPLLMPCVEVSDMSDVSDVQTSRTLTRLRTG